MQLREALAAKRPHETHYDLQVADSAAAEQRLQEASRAVTLATLRADSEALEAAESEREQAQAAVRACYHRLLFRPIPPHEFEALVSKHPPTAEQQKGKEVWNRDTLTPVLLEACTVDSDLTAAEWAAELTTARWSAADKIAVWRQALDCNVAQRSPAVPFG